MAISIFLATFFLTKYAKICTCLRRNDQTQFQYVEKNLILNILLIPNNEKWKRKQRIRALYVINKTILLHWIKKCNQQIEAE